MSVRKPAVSCGGLSGERMRPAVDIQSTDVWSGCGLAAKCLPGPDRATSRPAHRPPGHEPELKLREHERDDEEEDDAGDQRHHDALDALPRLPGFSRSHHS